MAEIPSRELPVEPVLEALEEYQHRTIAIYRDHPGDPEACVKALVALHLEWTEEDPERAKMVSRYRGEVMAGPGRERLSASNAAYFEETKRWLAESSATDEMPAVSFNMLHALVFAPTQEIAKHWLGGRLKRRPTEYTNALADAAWAGILAAGAALASDRLQERTQ